DEISKKIGPEYGEIFSVHRVFLQDKILREKTVEIIRRERINAESALETVLKKLGELFQRGPDDFFKDRRRDLLDIVERIITNLEPTGTRPSLPGKNQVIVAADLSPSQTASIDRRQVVGLAMEIGSPTSHAAIMARALELPAVVGIGHILNDLKDRETIIVDGETGEVIIQPEKEVLAAYREKRGRLKQWQKRLKTIVGLPSETADGHRVALLANIEFPEEAATVKKYGGEGIGLYRTEYLYLNRKDLPSEEEQYQAYRKVAELMEEKSVIIRTLDLGGDKFPESFGFGKERNPFLGWRAIRICLAREEIFIDQIKAILRASVHGHLKIMVPMVTTVEEVEQVHRILEKSRQQLRKEGKEFAEKIPLGILVEVPAAAILCEKLGPLVDFFSIGTNDLIQYTLAADRGNERVSHLYQPCHPAIISLIERVIQAGHHHRLKVSLCGEMAASPELACLLIGLGIDQLSMAPGAIPRVKEVIRRVTWERLQRIREQLSEFSTHAQIYDFLKKSLSDVLAES
ncbi:MAG TPA: phosphoenolpyruvate--protein phosphotransferase, partial [bacterium]|nr:phosphoenolpyruvate--protein phosphotransferase [bacterium]